MPERRLLHLGRRNVPLGGKRHATRVALVGPRRAAKRPGRARRELRNGQDLVPQAKAHAKVEPRETERLEPRWQP